MKKLLLLVCLFYSLLSTGQTIPFKFKNRRSEKTLIEKPNLGDLKKHNDSLKKANKDDCQLEEILVISNNKKTSYYTTLGKNIKAIYDERNKKINELYKLKQNERVEKIKSELNEEEFDKKEIKRLQLEIEELDELMLQDKIELNQLKKFYQEMIYKGRYVTEFTMFPVQNSTDAQLYYDYYAKDKKSQFLKNSIISFSSDGGKASIYNELFADYFGPIRVGVGALISNKETKIIDSLGVETIDTLSVQKDAVQRLLGGGGNVSFNTSFPILGYQNNDQDFSIKLIAAPKFAFDVPKLGTENKDYSVHADLGIEGSIFYTGVLDILTFYGNFRMGMVTGNKLFYEYLNTDNKSFLLNQASLGIALNSTFRISWNYYWGDKYVTKNFPSTISFTIIPN